MREISTNVTFELPSGEVVPVRVTRSTRLTVQCGSVWLTRSDDVEDYWLSPGEALRLHRGERLWLGAEDGARAQVTFAMPARAQERALLGLAQVADRLRCWLRTGWHVV